MSSHNINNQTFKEYSNKPAGGEKKFKKEYIKSIDLAKKILSQQNYDQNGTDIYFQIRYLYDNIPPKTSRINFRKKILNVSDIPQKNFKLIEHNLKHYESILTYKITIQEWQNFEQDLKTILENTEKFNSKTFNNILPKRLIDLIINLSLIYEIRKIPRHSKIVRTRLVKLYPMYDDMTDFIKRLGINKKVEKVLNIVYLSPEEFELIQQKCPWIIMEIEDVSALSCEVLDSEWTFSNFKLPNLKKDMPVIGVIDSGNSLKGDFLKFINGNYKKTEKGGVSDYSHGSMVSSLIIANDEMNGSAKDNLGNFPVRHFELLSKATKFDPDAYVSFNHLIKELIEIIENNQDIKVWNLSLGALKNPWTLRVSYQGMLIDYLSARYDCLFVIASGNNRKSIDPHWFSLNVPGDSLNALTVGSVKYDSDNMCIINAEYSSIGSVLNYTKPEVSHFGGENNQDGSPLIMHSDFGLVSNMRGTSFSTPRVSRIAAWLISKGYSVLETKAMIISLAKEENKNSLSSIYGFIEDCNEGLTLKTTIDLSSNKPLYLPLDLKNVDEIVISACNMAVPVHSLGEEYSIASAEIGIVQYRPDFEEFEVRTPEINSQFKKALDVENISSSNFLKEMRRRKNDGKYFTSQKKKFNIRKQPLIDSNWKYALRIRRTDLFELINKPNLKLGVVLSISGQNLNEDNFIKNNHLIIEVEVEATVGL